MGRTPLDGLQNMERFGLGRAVELVLSPRVHVSAAAFRRAEAEVRAQPGADILDTLKVGVKRDVLVRSERDLFEAIDHGFGENRTCADGLLARESLRCDNERALARYRHVR